MKIAIDARSMSHPQPGGFKTYTTYLVNNLLSSDLDDEFTILLDRPLSGIKFANLNKQRSVVIPYANNWIGAALREQYSLPKYLRRKNLDLIHFPSATGSLNSSIPIILTIHDAIEYIEKPIYGKNYKSSLKRILMRYYTIFVQRNLARQAKLIITDSDYSSIDLKRVLHIPDEKIMIIPLGHSEIFKPKKISEIMNFRQQTNLPEKFLLALASASPRKNILGLLQIYSILPQNLREQYHLVIIWAHNYYEEKVTDLISQLGIERQILFIHGVSDDDLVLFYNSASVFIFPSFYEGFGLPVLEAMACGTPVVSSNLTSIPEVAGSAAELADPRDEKAFSEKLLYVLSNPMRQVELKEKGMKRAAQFCWQRTAQLTLEAYREAIN